MTDRRSKGPAYWKNHIDSWSRSGLTQAEYCRLNKLSKSSVKTPQESGWRQSATNGTRAEAVVGWHRLYSIKAIAGTAVPSGGIGIMLLASTRLCFTLVTMASEPHTDDPVHLKAIIQEQQKEISLLREQLKLLKHHRFGPKAETVHPDQLPLLHTDPKALLGSEPKSLHVKAYNSQFKKFKNQILQIIKCIDLGC